MNARDFLHLLGNAISATKRKIPDSGEASDWTDFMLACILEMAKSDIHNMHMCARKLAKIDPSAIKAGDHMGQEFRYDITLYATKNWQNWSLPDVIIEHENDWRADSFRWDFWKLMCGYGKLRVMFGYAGTSTEIDKRVDDVRSMAKESNWQYPPNTEDLVVLRNPDGLPLQWRVLYRRNGPDEGREWKDLGKDTLDKLAEKITNVN